MTFIIYNLEKYVYLVIPMTLRTLDFEVAETEGVAAAAAELADDSMLV